EEEITIVVGLIVIPIITIVIIKIIN
ncbi:hypothetical protein LCGC14_3118280, partial [marine sediment metagenome]